jgi:hypothetical protein
MTGGIEDNRLPICDIPKGRGSKEKFNKRR